MFYTKYNLLFPIGKGMTRIFAALFFVFSLTGVSVALGQEQADPLKVLSGMEAAYAKVDDYTANFLKQERVGGKVLPEENIFLKFKKPFKVYMKWLKGPHEGREALFVRGKYDNKVVGHDSGILGFLNLKMDPNGKLAMRGNRHPITDVGIGRLIEIVMTNVRRGEKSGEVTLRLAGEEQVYGRQAWHIKIDYPPEKAKGYYCRKLDLWVDRELGLPVKIIVYGWKGEFLESYGYRELKINPGLKEEEFDKDYKDYNL